eukprot:gene2451-4759_t
MVYHGFSPIKSNNIYEVIIPSNLQIQLLRTFEMNSASRKKKTLYVGGIDSSVTEEILYAAFIPFGDLREVNIPKDYAENKNRGFGFVDFEEEEDAAAALENMDGAELFGKVLRCNIAKPMTKLQAGKAVWSAEEWIQNSLKEDGGEDDEMEQSASLVPLPLS